MHGFDQGNMIEFAGAVGNSIKDKLKKAAKHFLKKLLKKVLKHLFKLLLKAIAKALVALIAFLGIPTLIALVVIIIVGGAIVFVVWINGDDPQSIQKTTAAYNRAIEKTSKLEEYRPPLLVVQTIDNMRITKLGLESDDIEPTEIANALAPDLIYKTFENSVQTVVRYTDSEGYVRRRTYTDYTKVNLLVEAHAWNRVEKFTYSEHTEVERKGSTTVTTKTWVRDPVQCTVINTSFATGSPAPSLTGLGNKTHPFFQQYGPFAQQEARKSGVPASVTLAQAVEEGGWGKSELASKYYNFFGIKKHNWTGNTVLMWTTEVINGVTKKVQAEFRAYSSALEGFADHSKFLTDNARYKTAFTKKNPYEFANELQRAGYATNPSYATNLKNLMRNYNLLQYDVDGGIDPETGEPWKDIGYVPGPGGGGGNVSICVTPNFTKFDKLMQRYKFLPNDVEMIAAGIIENDSTRLMMAGYNGIYGGIGEGPLEGSDDGVSVVVPPVKPGQMIWPTTARYLTSNFGPRVNPTDGVKKLHKGIDIAPANSDNKNYPNIAAMDGIVNIAGNQNDGYGYKVVINHGDGLETLYAHMKAGSLKVKVGDKVTAGTVLGTMGATGDVTGRHLHFEVHVNGTPVNPLNYVHREGT